GEQQHDLRPSPDQVGAEGVHGPFREAHGNRGRESGPGLYDRVDPALVVLGGAQRSAVVVIAAPVPLAVPGLLEHAPEAPGLAAIALAPGLVASGFAEGGKLEEHAVEEEAHPGALPTSFASYAVHPVVPVPAAHEGKSGGAR